MIERRGDRRLAGAGARAGAALAAICIAMAGSSATAHADVTVSVAEPASGAAVIGVMALGADASADVVAVKWYVDGVEVAADGDGAPWSREWDSAHIAAGAHKVFAKARDAAGNWASSPSVPFTVENPPAAVDTIAPTLGVTSPRWGGQVGGDAVTLGVKAFDDVAVVRVKWYVDGSEVASDGDGAPWSRPWDSRRVPNGTHRVLAKARDAAGNWASSTSVPVTVDNAPCGTAPAPPPTWDHVVWIVFENKSFAQIIGSGDAPYLNQLSAACGLATDYHALAHPSLPNYIAMTSGSTQDITDDKGPAFHPLTAPSIFSQLGAGGWMALQESMPTNCAQANQDLYTARHNPAAYFVDLRLTCLTQDVPLGPSPDLSTRFTFITPNLCHDMHSSPCASTPEAQVAAGDAWLAGFLPKILTSAEYRSGSTAVFVTWDEDDSSSGQHIPSLVVAPPVRPGTSSATTFDHYSLLRTTEEMLGLPTDLGGAASATSMRDAFGI